MLMCIFTLTRYCSSQYLLSTNLRVYTYRYWEMPEIVTIVRFCFTIAPPVGSGIHRVTRKYLTQLAECIWLHKLNSSQVPVALLSCWFARNRQFWGRNFTRFFFQEWTFPFNLIAVTNLFNPLILEMNHPYRVAIGIHCYTEAFFVNFCWTIHFDWEVIDSKFTTRTIPLEFCPASRSYHQLILWRMDWERQKS